MNKMPTREQVERIKERYPIGTKIELISMEDPYSPIDSGTIGEIIWTTSIKWTNSVDI